jgi:DNA-binding transcriptional LysR family regulator
MSKKAQQAQRYLRPAAAADDLATRLRIKDLILLKDIATTGSLSVSAAKMHISQPAVSRMLQDIEALFGAKLFERIRSVGVVPTEAGRLVLLRAQILLTDVESLSNDLLDLREGRNGHLRLGLIPFVSDRFSQRLLCQLLSDKYRMSIDVQEGSTDHLVAEMRKSNLDAVIGRASATGTSAGLRQELLFVQRACLIVHPDNPIASKSAPDWKRLEGHTWLLPPRHSPTQLALNEFFASKGIAPPLAAIETASAKTIRALVSTQVDMIGIVPSDIGRDLESWGGVLCRPFPDNFRLPGVSAIYLAKNRDLPCIKGLRSALADLRIQGLMPAI